MRLAEAGITARDMSWSLPKNGERCKEAASASITHLSGCLIMAIHRKRKADKGERIPPCREKISIPGLLGTSSNQATPLLLSI
jgi:hypothetical protein